MGAHAREVLEVWGFSLLTCCWAGVNYGSHQVVQIPEVFSFPCSEHSGNVCCWEVACVLQTPGLKHPRTPQRNSLLKKGELRAGILFFQSPSCHVFVTSLSLSSASSARCSGLRPGRAACWALPLGMAVPEAKSYTAALIKASQGICIV